MNFIDLHAQYQAYKDAIDAAMREVVESCQFINGPQVGQLEEDLARFVGSAEAIGVSSGTDALKVVLLAWGIGPGDEVITTPFTFIATAEVIALLGAKPVFVEVEEDTLNLDPARLEEAITPRTRAIIPVSLYGQCADFDAINAIASRHGLPVLEDSCQSLGATYKGRRSGALSTASATSFFPSKPLGCYGDGGMVFTDDRELAKNIRAIKVHGQTARYRHDLLGLNARLDTLQAAILLAKLPYFQQEIDARQRVAAGYAQRMAGKVRLPVIRPENVSAFAQYTIRTDNRDQVADTLKGRGIPTAVHYPKPLHQQAAFAALGYQTGDFPISERLSDEVLSLPMHPFMTDDELDQVAEAVVAAVGG